MGVSASPESLPGWSGPPLSNSTPMVSLGMVLHYEETG